MDETGQGYRHEGRLMRLGTGLQRARPALPRAGLAPGAAIPWRALSGVLPWLIVAGAVNAQTPASTGRDYPSRPLRLVAPFPPGGSSDLVARVIAHGLGEALGQAVVTDNRAGAGGSIGTALVAKAAADGYTLLLAGVGPIATNVHLYADVGYDPVRDLAALTPVASAPTMLVGHPGVPAKSVKELLALARQKPGWLTCGSGGVGTPAHLGCEMFKLLARVDILHVAYKGSGQAINDLLGGQIHLVFASTPVGVPNLRSGKLRGFAVTSAQRTPQAADLPTLEEAGVHGYVFDSWWGAFMPARTPVKIVERVAADIGRVVQQADAKERFATLGLDPYVMSPKAFSALVRADVERIGKLVRETGIKAE
ncbi:MAG: tripartite tricarboxylate transporter substrate binding protein [Proteobacteria bacterium]|nr:tripartite tricarboxylate transporter substrate binding protein [Burkholderiales bacterium]